MSSGLRCMHILGVHCQCSKVRTYKHKVSEVNTMPIFIGGGGLALDQPGVNINFVSVCVGTFWASLNLNSNSWRVFYCSNPAVCLIEMCNKTVTDIMIL